MINHHTTSSLLYMEGFRMVLVEHQLILYKAFANFRTNSKGLINNNHLVLIPECCARY